MNMDRYLPAGAWNAGRWRTWWASEGVCGGRGHDAEVLRTTMKEKDEGGVRTEQASAGWGRQALYTGS